MSGLIPMVALVTTLVGTVVSCGGNSSGSPLISGETVSGAERCQNAYYSRIIGQYKGEAVFKVRAEDGSEAAACTWEIMMDFKYGGSPVVCDLVVEIQAPVTQSIVLDAEDADAFQCFPDESFRVVEDPHQTIPVDGYDKVRFPVDLKANQNFSFSTIGPYFEDNSAIRSHLRLLDRGFISGLTFNGNGAILFRSVSGLPFPFEGILQKDQE